MTFTGQKGQKAVSKMVKQRGRRNPRESVALKTSDHSTESRSRQIRKEIKIQPSDVAAGRSRVISFHWVVWIA